MNLENIIILLFGFLICYLVVDYFIWRHKIETIIIGMHLELFESEEE